MNRERMVERVAYRAALKRIGDRIAARLSVVTPQQEKAAELDLRKITRAWSDWANKHWDVLDFLRSDWMDEYTGVLDKFIEIEDALK